MLSDSQKNQVQTAEPGFEEEGTNLAVLRHTIGQYLLRNNLQILSLELFE